MLLKMDIEWQTLDGKTANEDPDDQLENFVVPGDYSNYSTKSLDWLEGLRYFTGGENQQATFNRTKINLKVSIPGLAGKTVKLKAFDVDDTTPSEWNTNGDLDDSDTAGDDNNLNWVPDLFAGRFTDTQSSTTTATLDANGEVIVEFNTSSHPGSNYRVAVTLDNFSTELDALQVSDSAAGNYVTADNEKVSNFPGVVTPLLTTWRKLHVEVDSMEAIPTDEGDDEKNYETGTIVDVPNPNGGTLLVLQLSENLTNHLRYNEFGSRIEVNGTAYSILDVTTSNTIKLITPDPYTSFIGQNYKIYDDDFDIFPLPLNGIQDELMKRIRAYYCVAFIEPTVATNPEPTFEFRLNEAPISILTSLNPVWDDSKNGETSSFFWYHLLAIGYQGSKGDDADGNPIEYLGGTPESGLFSESYSVIYAESIRDTQAPRMNYPRNRNDSTKSKYLDWMGNVAAHEIGHVTGSNFESGDHNEGGLMTGGGSTSLDTGFSAPSIKRLRSTSDFQD